MDEEGEHSIHLVEPGKMRRKLVRRPNRRATSWRFFYYVSRADGQGAVQLRLGGTTGVALNARLQCRGATPACPGDTATLTAGYAAAATRGSVGGQPPRDWPRPGSPFLVAPPARLEVLARRGSPTRPSRPAPGGLGGAGRPQSPEPSRHSAPTDSSASKAGARCRTAPATRATYSPAPPHPVARPVRSAGSAPRAVRLSTLPFPHCRGSRLLICSYCG